MRIQSIVAATLGAAVLVVAGSAPSLAGEITGNGKPTQGPAHANSICVFSGLEDGDGAGFPGPGGAPPQNWGHVKQFLRSIGTPESEIAATRPGIACNGHRGFLAGGGEE